MVIMILFYLITLENSSFKILSKIHFFITPQNYPAKVNLMLNPALVIDPGNVVDKKGFVIT